jgi:hypothetical protein
VQNSNSQFLFSGEYGGNPIYVSTVLSATPTVIDMWANPDPVTGRSWEDPNIADDTDPKNLGCTKWGGVPHLPDHLAHHGKRTDFVLQVDCAVLSRYDIRGFLPTTGFLWIFHSLQYPSERPFLTRYWNGPREQLKPRLQSQARAKPVYFVVGFKHFDNVEPEEGPKLFYCEEEEALRQTYTFEKNPGFNAAFTLLCIRKHRQVYKCNLFYCYVFQTPSSSQCSRHCRLEWLR